MTEKKRRGTRAYPVFSVYYGRGGGRRDKGLTSNHLFQSSPHTKTTKPNKKKTKKKTPHPPKKRESDRDHRADTGGDHLPRKSLFAKPV